MVYRKRKTLTLVRSLSTITVDEERLQLSHPLQQEWFAILLTLWALWKTSRPFITTQLVMFIASEAVVDTKCRCLSRSG